VKSRRANIHTRVHKIPTVQYESQKLTSFAGAVLIQSYWSAIGMKETVRRCFQHLKSGRIFGLDMVFLQLIVHILLGFRRLRDRDYYCDDPLLCRLLGVSRLPDVGTISRTLQTADGRSVERVRGVLREQSLAVVEREQFARVTLDFDGSVLSTKGHAEGTAVGFNPKHRGARSYYPLFCTVAQTGQFFDVHHRPGNVHDSNGATAFIDACLGRVRERAPRSRLESRLDSAFFSEGVLAVLQARGVDFSISVPFERFPTLKHLIDSRCRWTAIDDTFAYFETEWSPKSWDARHRIILIRKTALKQRKGPLQLDLFEPRDTIYEYKAFVTNKTGSAAAVLEFHHGRGAQEAIFGEGKQWAALDYIPCRRLFANQLYTCAALIAHNTARDMQVHHTPRRHDRNSPTRQALWDFLSLGTLRRRFFQRAGRLTRPAGHLTLTVSANDQARNDFAGYLDSFAKLAA